MRDHSRFSARAMRTPEALDAARQRDGAFRFADQVDVIGS
jgi:hypothetical protein